MSRYGIKGSNYSFVWKVIACGLMIAAGDILFYQQWVTGAIFGLFAVAWTAAILTAHRFIWRDRRALSAAGFAFLFGAALIFDPSVLAWAMFWTAITMAVLLPRTQVFDDGWRWFQRLFIYACCTGFAPVLDLFKVSRARRRRPGPSVRKAIPTLVLPAIGSIIIVALFASANPIIGDFVATLQIQYPEFNDILRGFLWTGLLLLTWVSFRPRLARRLLGTFDGTGDVHIPGVSIASVRLSLIMFNLLFAGQNILDIAYLWSGQGLPDGMTMAQYAHRGAYPLIATALLAGLFVLVTLRPGSATATVPMIRGLVVLWILQNIFLVASSMLRTVDYIEAYSLTQFRIAALVWMALVAAGLLLICVRMFMGRNASWLINSNLVVAGAVLTAYCFVDTGEIAARWNIDHAREVGGKGTNLDFDYLSGLGSSALLPIITLEQNQNAPDLQSLAKQVRHQIMLQMAIDQNNHYWTYRDNARFEAAKQLIGPLETAKYVPFIKPVTVRSPAAPNTQSLTKGVEQ